MAAQQRIASCTAFAAASTADAAVLECVLQPAATDAATGAISFQGESDAQLTKGLVTLLVDGLSGYAPADIQGVSPEFIKFAGQLFTKFQIVNSR